jgi:hypothetical protein
VSEIGRGIPQPIHVDGKCLTDKIQSSLATSLRQKDFWDVTVGPFYDAPGLLKWLGVTQQVLQDMTESEMLLSVATAEGDLLYPTFQFGPAGEALPHLAEIVRLLEPITDDNWDKAIWLNTPTTTFDGRTAADSLRDGDAELVLAAAARDGRVLEN